MYKNIQANRGCIINSFVRDAYSPGMKILDIGAASCCWNTDKLPVEAADIMDNSLPDSSFDIIVASEVLEHIAEVEKAVQEAYRLLKDGGVFVVFVPRDTIFSAWRRGHLQHFSLSSACWLLASEGFTVETAFSVAALDLFITATKNKNARPRKKKYGDLTAIIPTLNEGGQIGELLRSLTELYPGIRIIVSDDGSRDGTVKCVEEAARQNPNICLCDRRHKKVKGLAASVLDGIKMVETKYFLVMDGDGQHPCRYVSYIYNHLTLGTQLCVGTRALMLGWPWSRKMLVFLGSCLGKISLRLRKKQAPADILSGFWGMETAAWRENTDGKSRRFYLKGYKVLFDFLKICSPSLKMENAYFVFRARTTGESKAGLKVYLQYLRSLIIP